MLSVIKNTFNITWIPIIDAAEMASFQKFIYCCLSLLCLAGSLVLAEIGCPPPETITPCICDDRASPRLACSNIHHVEDIERVFENSARYTFQEVHIRSSSVLYFPSMMIEEVRINELYIEDSAVTILFEKAPVTETLEKLQLVNTIVQRGFTRSVNLTQVTNLKTLTIMGVKVPRLDSTFKDILPSSLKRIILHGTGTKKIYPGVFDNLTSLDKLQVSSGKLKSLSRDMFPQPFNVRFLYFDNNNISYIPDDLFTDMPELQFLSMKNNNIAQVPEAAFGYRQKSIPYFRLDGNPLQCNCLLVWLVKNKPQIVGGTCHTPSRLMGKNLEDLLPGDFNCF